MHEQHTSDRNARTAEHTWLTAGEVGLYLPPGWTSIPLASPAGRAHAIRAVVARQCEGTAATPALRAQLIGMLTRTTSDAASLGGTVFALHLAAPQGVPMPMTLTMLRPPQPATLALLRQALRSQPNVVEAQLDAGWPIVRRVRTLTARTGETHMPQLTAEYWTEPGDGSGLLHTVFTTPLVDQADALTELFDSIASTTTRIPRQPRPDSMHRSHDDGEGDHE